MPRDLTDLMERATAFAPPEPYAAADVTALAARRQRRRTASIVGGLALAVVVAGVAGYGVTRSHDSAPEPAGPYRYGRTVDVSSAVPANRVPGFHEVPWKLRSMQHFGPGLGPLATYQGVDAEGRLLVVDYPTGDPQKGARRVRLYDAPGASPHTLPQPPSPGSNSGHPIGWVPSFLDDGRLIWSSMPPIVHTSDEGVHVTDLEGGHDQFVHTGFTVGQTSFGGTPQVRNLVSDDRYVFSVYDHNLPGLAGGSYTLWTATFSGRLTRLAGGVVEAGAGQGTIAWITTTGQLMTEAGSGGPARPLTIPFDAGCRLPTTEGLQAYDTLLVSGSVIALPEVCGPVKSSPWSLLAFDTSGRRLVHVTGVSVGRVSMAGDALLFLADDLTSGDGVTLRYDLVTGSLVTLGDPVARSTGAYPQGSGRYVLWYDGRGGHVGEFAG